MELPVLLMRFKVISLFMTFTNNVCGKLSILDAINFTIMLPGHFAILIHTCISCCSLAI